MNRITGFDAAGKLVYRGLRDEASMYPVEEYVTAAKEHYRAVRVRVESF